MEKKTFGQSVNEHRAKKHDTKASIVDIRRLAEPEIMGKVTGAVKDALTYPDYKNKDFYIVLLMWTDYMTMTPNSLALARQSCPSPGYEQTLWKYHHISGELKLMWHIPDKFRCFDIKNDPFKYMSDPKWAEVAKDVYRMNSGELDALEFKENGGKPHGIARYKTESENA